MKHTQLLFLLIILVLASSVFLPIDMVYSVDTVARVYPARQWVLRQEADGSVVSTVYNYRNGTHEAFRKYQFERGDVVGLNMLAVSEAGRVRLGDSVVSISSFLLEQELLQRQNELALARASLRTLQVGRKAPVIRESEQQLSLAEERLVLAGLNYERNKELYESGVIAKAAFDVFNNEYQLARIGVQAAESRLLDVRTGDRPEDINLVQNQIRAAEREIELLVAKRQSYTIDAPISGKISFGSEKGSLLVVSDTADYVLTLPLEQNEWNWLPVHAKVKVRPAGEQVLDASMTGLSETVDVLDNRQVRLARAEFDAVQPPVLPGMSMPCTVICDTISLWQYTRRKFSFALK
jgi:hypothetical protein